MNLSASFHCSFEETFDLSDPSLAVKWLYTQFDLLLIKVVIPLISSIGILGNGAFLFMVMRLPEMRSTLTAYLVNLAMCDMLYLLFLNMVYFREGPVSRTFYVNSLWGCMALPIYINWWYYASSGFVTLISVERYFAICKPLKAMVLKGFSRNIKLVLTVWILSLAVTLTTVPQFAKFTQSCVIWPETETDGRFQNLPDVIRRCQHVGFIADNYSNVLSISSFVLTAIVNSALYSRIIFALGHRQIGGNAPLPAAENVRDQVARTLIVNGIIFFICQTPYRLYTLVDFLQYIGLEVSPFMKSRLFYLGGFFLLLNSIVNPYLYILTCAHYRRCMMKAFCSMCSSPGLVARKKLAAQDKMKVSLATMSTSGGMKPTNDNII